MKQILSLAILVFSFSALADKIELSQKSRIYTRDGDYYSIALDKYEKLNTGTFLEVDTENQIYNIEYGNLLLVREVYGVDNLDGKKRRKRMRTLNELTSSGEGQFYIKEEDVERSQRLSRQSFYETRVIDTSIYGYDRNEYTSCYANPVARVRYLDKRKAKRARNKKLIGLGLSLAGGIVDIATDGDTGDAVSGVLRVAGAGFYLYGAVELDFAREVIYLENGYNCRSFYEEDYRTYEFSNDRGRRCETKRYYSNRWNGRHEYFKTKCRKGRSYMSFKRHDRHNETWGY